MWVIRIRSGYTLQFGQNPLRFDRVHLTVVSSTSKASVLQQELSSLLLKGAIEGVPESDLKQGFFSRYFLLPKKDEGLWPILDPEFPAPLGIDAFAHPWPTVRLYAFPSSQANSGSPVQGEGERCPSPTRSPVLAIPDVVLRADSSSVSAPLGDSDQARPSLSTSGQDLVSSAWYLEAVGMAHPGSLTLISSLPA